MVDLRHCRFRDASFWGSKKQENVCGQKCATKHVDMYNNTAFSGNISATHDVLIVIPNLPDGEPGMKLETPVTTDIEGRDFILLRQDSINAARKFFISIIISMPGNPAP